MDRPVSPPPSKNPERAPEPLRQVMASAAVKAQAASAPANQNGKVMVAGDDGGGFNIPEPPMLGTLPSIDSSCSGSVNGRTNGCSSVNGSITKKFETIEVTPVRPPASPVPASCNGDVGAVSPISMGAEGKSADEVLADDTASEEIFGKAFRGGPQAAAGLAARLQREVSCPPFCRET